MSDKYFRMSKCVKLCRSCLIRMSIFVVLCQTIMSTIVVASETITSSDGENGYNQEEILSIDVNQELGQSNQEEPLIGENNSELSGEDLGNTSIIDTGDTLSQLSDNVELQTLELNNDGVQELFMLPQLRITEVRIDGTDEYIEITNRGDPFMGTVAISGVKTSNILTLSLMLGTHESIVIGDTLAMVVQSGFVVISNQSLSMTDTAARSIQLIYSGQTIDSLDLIATQVLGSDNLKASREYDVGSATWIISSVDHSTNVISGEYGNPGLVWGLTRFGNSGDTTLPGTSTGDNNTGSNNTGTMATGYGIQIQEVYPFSDCLGEHLSLYFTNAYSGALTIVGLGTSDTSKTFTISAETGSLWYIVESLSGVLSDNVILVPNITLTDGGESLIVQDASGYVLDSVAYSSTLAGKASNYTNSSGSIRLFTSNRVPTLTSTCHQSVQQPQIGGCRISTNNTNYDTGFFINQISVSGSLVSSGCEGGMWSVNGQTLLTNTCELEHQFAPGSHRIIYQQYSGSNLVCEDEYMIATMIHLTTVTTTNTITIVQTGTQHSCGIVTQNNTPFALGNSINLIASLDDKQLQNSSSYTCQRSGLTFTGSDSCNPGYFSLNQTTIAPISLTISKDGQQLCQTQSFINYPASTKTSVTTSSTYYEDLYRKRKSKHETLAGNIRVLGCTVNAQDQLGKKCSFDAQSSPSQASSDTSTQQNNVGSTTRFQDYQGIQIVNIIADPPGRDSDGGELVQLRQEDDRMSNKHLLLIINNKANRIVSGSGRSGDYYSIYDSFPLPNAGGCVALTDLTIVYDQLCYDNYESNHIFDLSTLSVTVKLRKQYEQLIGLQPDIPPDSELDLLNLDLKEQKLINKLLKQQHRATVSEIRDRYHTRTNELYVTYRSITDQKQSYIEKLQGVIHKTQQYANDITNLYRQTKSYRDQYWSLKNTYDPLMSHIRQSYPALRLDPKLAHVFGSGEDSGIVELGISQSYESLSWWSTLKQVFAHLLNL